MAGVGFTNKNDLPKWDKNDLEKARNCLWMKDRDVKKCNKLQDNIKELMWWHEKLFECLPSVERYEFSESIKKLSVFLNINRFRREVERSRYLMIMKLIAFDVQKHEMINPDNKEESLCERAHRIQTQQNKLIDQNSNMIIPGSTLPTEDYRFANLIQMYPDGSPDDMRQKNDKITGYVPIKEVLSMIPPMEIMEYCDFKLIKYDKWHGYYAIMLIDNNNQTKVFYGDNPQKLELQAELEFDELIDKYIEQNSKNPYGDKSFNSIDISNVTSVMGYNGSADPSDPLNSNDIF